MMSKRRAFAVWILLGLLSLHCGCGSEHGVDRLPVHGTVKMAGGELLNGSITFRPKKDKPGPSATTNLAEGKYEFDSTNGPTAGPHDVIIRRVVKRADAHQPIAAKQGNQENGTEWNLSADVVDNGQYLQDFTLDK
jgi:hypothetical protein